MARRRVVTAAAVLAVALGSVTAFAGHDGPAPLPSTGATPTRVVVKERTATYPVFDARGRRLGTAAWRTSQAGGNCCETYVTATKTGRLVESGGTYPWYTDDLGKHWFQVKFDVPDQNDNGAVVAGGEGATVSAPNGDVYGITWDAYSGDHLQAYRYRAQTNSWSVSEVVLKTPVYDRPWLAYARGPYTLDGKRSNQILTVMGGTLTKDVFTLSADGLDYSDASYYPYDEERQPTATMRIPVVRDPDADWWQPHPDMNMLALSGGDLIRFGAGSDAMGKPTCATARLTPSSTWQCVKLAGHFQGEVRQDSRGYLTEVYPEAGYGRLVLATSRDGGLHWSSITLTPPKSTHALRLEAPDMYDVVANGKLGQAVVSARFADAQHRGHDLVFRVDTRKARPRLMKTYAVGLGDLVTEIGVGGSTGDRYDYESVTLLPDGRIAISFDDSTCLNPSARDATRRTPQVAILL